MPLGKTFICKVETVSIQMRRLIEPSHLDLCCLQKPIIIACGSERVNSRTTVLSTSLGKAFFFFFFFFFAWRFILQKNLLLKYN